MKSRRFLFWIIGLFLILGSFSSFPSFSWGAQKVDVTFHYQDWDQLSLSQQAQLQAGIPNETITFDEVSYTFVYQKTKTSTSADTPANSSSAANGNNTSSLTSHEVSEMQSAGTETGLPKTGDTRQSYITLVGGCLLIVAVGVYIWKRRQLKQLLLLLIILSGLGVGAGKNVQAVADTKLHARETQQITKGAHLVKEPQTIAGYTYRGYLRTARNHETSGPNKTETVAVHYEATDGTVLSDIIYLEGEVGTVYQTPTKEFAGYVQKTVEGTPTGLFQEQAQVVKYLYEKQAVEAKLILRFVNALGQPFVVPDFSAMKNGDFVALYPNLDQYTVKLDYNGHTYQQNETVAEIIFSKDIGDSYTLPKQVRFTIQDERGQHVNYLSSLNEDYSSSGPAYWGNYWEEPTNYAGTIQAEQVVVTYIIRGSGYATAAP
ncbi:MucBP domain-containing protein [Enterococcus faecalis]